MRRTFAVVILLLSAHPLCADDFALVQTFENLGLRVARLTSVCGSLAPHDFRAGSVLGHVPGRASHDRL